MSEQTSLFDLALVAEPDPSSTHGESSDAGLSVQSEASEEGLRPVLRPDQLALVADYDAARAAGHRCVVLQAATGFGKSVVLAFLASRAIGEVSTFADLAPGSIVIVSHLGEINRALVEHLTRAGCPEPYLYGHAGDPRSPVVVVSAQAVEAGGLHFPACQELYVDEGHRAGAASYERFIAAHVASGARVTLATATPARSDGKALPFVTAIVCGPQVSALVAASRLAPITVIAPREHASTLAADPVELYPAGRPGIVFAASVPHSIALAQQLTYRGVIARHVDGTQHASTREQILADFQGGHTQVLTCFRLFTEGVDAPRAEVTMLASSVGSTVTFLQAVGRARRFVPGKRALLLDLCGSMHLHGHPDWDRTYHVDGEAIRAVQPPADQAPVMCKTCGAWGLPRSVCEVCGATRPAPTPPKVRAADLIEHRVATTDQAAQRERLKLEIDKKLASGKNPWSALFWFAGVFGEPAKRRESPWAEAYIRQSGWRKKAS